MAYHQLPTTADLPHWSMQIDLDGESYSLVFHWNTREGFWYVHLYEADEVTPIRLGAKLVLGFPLFLGDLPGALYATLPGGLTGEQGDLARMTLYYIDRESLAEVAAA